MESSDPFVSERETVRLARRRDPTVSPPHEFPAALPSPSGVCDSYLVNVNTLVLPTDTSSVPDFASRPHHVLVPRCLNFEHLRDSVDLS